jgi:hypothetical protein
VGADEASGGEVGYGGVGVGGVGSRSSFGQMVGWVLLTGRRAMVGVVVKQ